MVAQAMRKHRLFVHVPDVHGENTSLHVCTTDGQQNLFGCQSAERTVDLVVFLRWSSETYQLLPSSKKQIQPTGFWGGCLSPQVRVPILRNTGDDPV